MLHWTDLGRASKEKNMWFCNLPIPTVWTSSPEGKPCGFWDFILWCFDLFFCLEQLVMFQSGFVDLGGIMFPDDILLKSVYDWCNVLRPWIKSAGLKGSKRGGKVPVPAKLGRSMGCYSLEPRADKAVWARCGGSVLGGGERAARQHAPGRAWAQAQQRAPASMADMLMNLLYPVIILIPYMGDKGN